MSPTTPTSAPIRPRPLLIVAACAVSWAIPLWAGDGPEDPDPSRFEEAIRAFEQDDREAPPEPGGILFVGSSSIRRWDLGESFPDLDALNRGFGGSQLSDVIHYADRVILPYHPRVVVLYEGDNDLAAGKSPERVRDDFVELVRIVRDEVPAARLLVLAIKPSPARAKLRPEMTRANALIALACEGDDRLEFVDVASQMLGPGGELRPELYANDRLHLSDQGYAIWAETLWPYLRGDTSSDRP